VIDDAEDGEVARGGLDHHPAGGQKNTVPVAGPQRNRKGLESSAGAMDRRVLPKQRSLEIYLNIAELRAIRPVRRRNRLMYAFGHSAGRMSPREVGASLAAILPNPVKRSARNPRSLGVRRLAGTYMARAQAVGPQPCWRENRGF